MGKCERSACDRVRAESAAEIALVAAQDQDGRQKDAEEQVIFRQKKGDEDPDANPEQDKTQSFFHISHRPKDRRIYFIYMQKPVK